MEMIGDPVAETEAQINDSTPRKQTAQVEHAFVLVSTFCVGLLAFVFWQAYNQRRERAELVRQQVVAVIGVDGKTTLVERSHLGLGPTDAEIMSLAAQEIDLIEGANPDDVETRFAYARRKMSADMQLDFDAGLGSPQAIDAIKSGRAEGHSFYRKLNVSMRQLEASDLDAGFKFPARLAYPRILPRFDQVVEGTVETYSKEAPGKRLDVRRVTYWVRLSEIERRTVLYPEALLVEWIQPIKPRLAAQAGTTSKSTEKMPEMNKYGG